MSFSAPILVGCILLFSGICLTALAHMLFPKEQSPNAPDSETDSVAPDEITVPFSYSVPVDSHMNYKKDVVIVVEHPDDRIAVGMVAR